MREGVLGSYGVREGVLFSWFDSSLRGHHPCEIQVLGSMISVLVLRCSDMSGHVVSCLVGVGL